MNTTSNLNSELLSADARGRKHIPFAVFAVILVHVILFLVLLIAAGCRARAHTRRNPPEGEQLATTASTGPSETPSTQANSPATSRILPVAAEPVSAEPVLESVRPQAQPVKRASLEKNGRATKAPLFYVVQAGDTVEKIARKHRTSIQAIRLENKLKNDLLHPGQKLRVSSEKPNHSNEV